jgi:hypothetical protein
MTRHPGARKTRTRNLKLTIFGFRVQPHGLPRNDDYMSGTRRRKIALKTQKETQNG